MAREEVSFARGSKATMPQDKVPGRLLVATDTGEAYVDDTSDSRVQLKDSTKVSKSGDTMSGPLNMGSNKITAVSTPTADTDAANYGSVKSEIKKNQYTGGTAITVDNEEHTISHSVVGSAGSIGPTANATPEPGETFNVPQITTDAQGHVSSKTNRTITMPKYTAGTGLTISGTAISHADNGTAGSYGPTGNATPGYGGTFEIPQITTNAQGHVTAITMRTVTLPSAQDIPEVQTYTGVSPISVSGTQISHDNIGNAGSVGPTGDSTATHGGTITIPYITVDAKGHVSAKSNRTITLPGLDVIDNLESEDTNKPLSANQGNVLSKIIGSLSSLTTSIKTSIVDAINEKVSKSGDIMTGDLTIHKNEPSLLLKNTQGGDQGIKMHYYGLESGKNTFSIYDVANAKQLLKIAQANAYAEFAGGIKSGGGIQSLGANNYGTVYAGDKIRMYTDAEGGNLRIFPPNDTGDFWEFDAYNGNMRLFHYDAANKKVNTQFNFGSGGTVSAPCVKNVFTVTEAGYVADARALKALNDKIVTLTSSLSPTVLASNNSPAVGTTLNFTSNAPLLIVDFSNGSACESMIIVNEASNVTYMMSLVWSTTTLSRITFQRTSTGIKVQSMYACGDWTSAAHGIVVRSIG